MPEHLDCFLARGRMIDGKGSRTKGLRQMGCGLKIAIDKKDTHVSQLPDW
ncbi:hypothetical protein AA0229_2310 [Gluconobacter cerinus NRIC 0229]|nr:hypothetical protein AA0229_2310 [Gluconobacter cerinus NRIC 0229]